jgi:hypothetical protein
VLWGCACLLISWMASLKWAGLMLLLIFAFALATPDYLVDKKFDKAVSHMPLMGFGMILALLGIGKKK